MAEKPTTEADAGSASAEDPRHAEAHGAVAADVATFGRDELAQFDKDDRDAGSAIGKMLSLFFFYTVVAMSIVAWWTYKAASQ